MMVISNVQLAPSVVAVGETCTLTLTLTNDDTGVFTGEVYTYQDMTADNDLTYAISGLAPGDSVTGSIRFTVIDCLYYETHANPSEIRYGCSGGYRADGIRWPYASGLLYTPEITVLDMRYAPKVEQFSVRRGKLEDGTVAPDNSGVHAMISLSASLATGADASYTSAKVYYKPRTSATWTLCGTIDGADAVGGVVDRSVTSALDTVTEYDFRVEFGDGYDTATAYSSVGKSTALVHIPPSLNGIGVGTFISNEYVGVRVALPVSLEGGVTIDGFAVPKVQSGRVAVTFPSSGGAAFDVTFPMPFSSAPNVVATIDTDGAGWGVSRVLYVQSTTATGCTLRAVGTAASAYARWIAVGT